MNRFKNLEAIIMLKRYMLIVASLLGTTFLCNAAQSSTISTSTEGDESDLIGGHAIRFAMPILVVAPDARAGGIGDIGIATSPDANSQNWNASKYAFMETQYGASLSYIPWLRNIGASNINLLYLTGYYKFDEFNSIGTSLRYFSLGNLTFLGMNNEQLQTGNPNEFAFDFSYTRLLGENISMSLTARYIQSDLTGGFSSDLVRVDKARAAAADLGIYYNKPTYVGNNPSSFAIGAGISNIGNKMSYSASSEEENSYFLPTTLRVGGEWLVNFNVDHDVAFNLELSKYLVPTPPVRDTVGNVVAGMDDNVNIFQGMVQSFYDAPGGFKEEMQEIMFGLGVEYSYMRQFMARIGYYYDYKSVNRKYLTIGAGLRYQMLTLDVAYLIPTVSGFSNPLANTIRITLSLNMGHAASNRQTNMPQRNTRRGGGFFN